MLVCDQFVFVHLHKSGGTFVNELMLRCLPGARRIGYHLPYGEIADALRPLPVLGTVRNPLAYYVSWYHFQSQLPAGKRNALFNICSRAGELDFAGTIENLVDLHERADLLSALQAAFPDHFTSHGLNLTKSCIGRILGSGHGFYSFLHDRMYEGAEERARILPMETLRPALADYLAERCATSSPAWQAFLAHAPDMNVSRHARFSDYYAPPLKARVERLDGALMEKYGY